ncbi:sodium:calcium antiporter [Candidatus Woesearchaeota archaeon]|jgi:cation:H+ antiporter|nr:sodium:calcium antiporter [Candidatus Woesearchaeota archaeon]MBT5740646.1 sodium:calcium antiporter [Candidatus Woesearchaeota archaeon]
MLIEIFTILAGVVIILALAEIIVMRSISVASHFGVSGTFVGLTVLSIGTSIPEIMTHIVGSIEIVSDPTILNTMSSLLIGTNIGSDIFQQNFILGIVGLLGAVYVVKKNLLSEVGGLILAALLVWFFSFGGFISRIEGAVLLLAYVAYLIYIKRTTMRSKELALNHLTKRKVWSSGLLVLFCFIIMAMVSYQVLNASTVLVELLPISASFFGLLILGIATALPELTTALVAALKHKKDISAGVLIGSNITNPLFGIGLGAMISTYTVPSVVIWYDLPFKLITAFFIFYFLFRNEKLNKWEAVVLILLFLVYLVVRLFLFPVDF